MFTQTIYCKLLLMWFQSKIPLEKGFTHKSHLFEQQIPFSFCLDSASHDIDRYIL